MQPIGIRLRGRGQGLRALVGGRGLTPRWSEVSPLGSTRSGRPDPVLRFTHAEQVPAGDFAASAIANVRLRSDMVPSRGAAWELVEEFALTYDGYAYWSDVAELGNRSLQTWTRDRTLPKDLHELRGCLFYEQRRWHHFGEEAQGRGADYVWALLDAIRARVTLRVVPDPVASPAPSPAPVAPAAPLPVTARPVPDMMAPAPPHLPAPPRLPSPPAPVAVHAVGGEPPVATAVPRRVHESASVFVDDDTGYLAWTGEHRAGFVVNAARGASAKALRLHKATCPSIAGKADSGRSWTSSYRKVCATEVSALLDWCVEVLGADPEPCQRCRP